MNASESSTILILGGGCFGLTAALELRARGWQVTLIDQGPLPYPDAASTDISKVVRMDYAQDEQHTAMGELSLQRWREWNAKWGEELYHEVGFLVMSRDIMQPGGFEHDSRAFLTQRGHSLRSTSSEMLREQHPAWNHTLYRDGYLNPVGGWAESGRVIARLAIEARAAGVTLIENVPQPHPLFEGSRCTGITSSHQTWQADAVLVAAGAWTPTLLPHLQDVMWATAQTVFHFQPQDPRSFTPPQFPVWGADIGKTGWYGFPANADGLVKVANHGPGRRVNASDLRTLPTGEEDRYRAFLRETFPSLADAPLHSTRVCLYCDTFDGAFWIDHDPAHPNLIIAAGDSGHAFKFTPVMGEIIADVVERKPNPWAKRYRWREKTAASSDGARASG
ncbi:MAG: FAD-dependent oxidoreductase [Prosthecobacter sp.]|uniref:NAD(P)/FAD-dependent oxidoreductase n=1 Tax=Prosthecobacter sp. TaxID=1965333 RepID=UPI0025EDF3B0|nr:FAD-dependent oxidoreductase [Prosthecobacter sp.]MCF7787762.1 FAD-dependent oxidoreductase [Prosthecobacter sp.]